MRNNTLESVCESYVAIQLNLYKIKLHLYNLCKWVGNFVWSGCFFVLVCHSVPLSLLPWSHTQSSLRILVGGAHGNTLVHVLSHRLSLTLSSIVVLATSRPQYLSQSLLSVLKNSARKRAALKQPIWQKYKQTYLYYQRERRTEVFGEENKSNNNVVCQRVPGGSSTSRLAMPTCVSPRKPGVKVRQNFKKKNEKRVTGLSFDLQRS